MIKLSKTKLLRFNQDKIKNKNILMRVDFNIEEGIYRIKVIKKTLNFLKPAKRIVLISHYKDPKRRDKKYSLKKILPKIEGVLKTKISFFESLDFEPKEKINLLENIRFWKEEKELNFDFVKKLAKFGDIFINEAFSVSHRKHASVYLLPKILPTFYGLNFEKEINLLNKVLKAKNLGFILGGAKISTKLPLIKKFLKKAQLIILSGGIANTYLKAKGFEIGKSLIEEELINKVKKLRSEKILVPFDFSVLNKNKVSYKNLGEIKKDDIIYDIGDLSLNLFFDELKKIKTIIWNGPLGYIENKNFEKGTLKLAMFLTNLKNKFILVGGGDTLGFLERKKLINKFKNISTGGGAMLEYLTKKTLPIWEQK